MLTRSRAGRTARTVEYCFECKIHTRAHCGTRSERSNESEGKKGQLLASGKTTERCPWTPVTTHRVCLLRIFKRLGDMLKGRGLRLHAHAAKAQKKNARTIALAVSARNLFSRIPALMAKALSILDIVVRELILWYFRLTLQIYKMIIVLHFHSKKCSVIKLQSSSKK